MHTEEKITVEKRKKIKKRDIEVALMGNDMLIGGMTYRIDPELKEPVNGPGDSVHEPCDKLRKLMECLDIEKKDIKKVCVKKISVDIVLETDCDCD